MILFLEYITYVTKTMLCDSTCKCGTLYNILINMPHNLSVLLYVINFTLAHTCRQNIWRATNWIIFILSIMGNLILKIWNCIFTYSSKSNHSRSYIYVYIYKFIYIYIYGIVTLTNNGTSCLSFDLAIIEMRTNDLASLMMRPW